MTMTTVVTKKPFNEFNPVVGALGIDKWWDMLLLESMNGQ
jgi:hypothetical protein